MISSSSSSHCYTFMFFLQLVYFLIQSDLGDAAPIPSIERHDDPPSCNDLNNYRTKGDIIWGCISTILLCTWVSLNPNIPAGPRRDPKGWFERRVPHWLFKLLTNKLPLFLCALLAPEYILGWAIRQNLMARRIQKEGGQRLHPVMPLLKICRKEHSRLDTESWFLSDYGRIPSLSSPSRRVTHSISGQICLYRVCASTAGSLT